MPENWDELRKVLERFRRGELSEEETLDALRLRREDAGTFARLDFDRHRRKGLPETVFCPGKQPEHLQSIVRGLLERNGRVLCTRATPEQYSLLQTQIPELTYDPVSRLMKADRTGTKSLLGCIAVCTGGSADIPAAEEAAGTAEFLGSRVERFYDVGVAGIHRLFRVLPEIRHARVVIAAAGMEGALGSVIAGLVAVPVIGLPTSVGYGASFGGVAALLAMMNSCAEGMACVNIDNGFGAGTLAHVINVQGMEKT